MYKINFCFPFKNKKKSLMEKNQWRKLFMKATKCLIPNSFSNHLIIQFLIKQNKTKIINQKKNASPLKNMLIIFSLKKYKLRFVMFLAASMLETHM